MNSSIALFAGIALPFALALTPIAPSGAQGACKKSAADAHHSCRKAAAAEFWLQRAKCLNLPSAQLRLECIADALHALDEAFDGCEEQLDARREVCESLGGGIYHPEIDPDDFVEVIDHPYLPFLPGASWVYEKESDGEVERIEVTVTGETVEILGVTCTQVRDVVSIDGEVQEDTRDWFAQDECGNVWYFGEISLNFEDGEIASLSGSWKAGEDGAKPGIVMLAKPGVGDVYRQEFLIGEAEDVGGVLSLKQPVTVPYGSFKDCLQTEDYSPLSPGALEHKFYAQGVGLVLELDPESGERTELIEFHLD